MPSTVALGTCSVPSIVMSLLSSALVGISRLKATATRGMVINPTSELSIDAYPDADFAGMYGYENPTDPACAKSRSGFIIVFAGVPVMWQSKLKTETALSTMEAEIMALAACMIPIIDMVQSLAAGCCCG